MSGPVKAQVRQKIEQPNFISIKIGHVGVRALIDTGAFHSCVSLSLLKRLKLESRIIPVSQNKRLFAADGKAMKVLATVELTLDIQEVQIPVTFCVLSCLQHDMILGITFLNETKANIDMESHVLTLYNDLLGVNLISDKDVIVRTADAVLIPPRSEALIPVSIPPHFGSGLSIIEPSIKLHTLQLALAKSMVSPVRNRTVCKIMNPTNVAKFIKRRTPLGVIRNLAVDSMTVIDDIDSTLKPPQHPNKDDNITYARKLEILTEKGINLQQNSLSLDEYYDLIDLLFENRDLFATSMHDLVGTDVVEMEIDTGDAQPVRKRAYRQSPQMMREMERQVQEMVAAGIVEPSDSPWSSPCLLIKKSGTNEYRFVNDLRAVNQLTKPIFWPLPTLEDIFDTVADRSPSIFF